jgi:DHA1 family bicyclomycin/chloramphenicol resistance-like MFS transporter
MQQTVNRSHIWLILSLGILNALTPFTIDLYLPSFADIAKDLSSTVPKVSLSVATYFIGFALGQIIYGPLLDRFGRKPPIFGGLSLYIFASIGCMTAQSVEALWIFRFLAALGGSAASVAATTMVRDYFDPKEGAKVFSMLMLVLSVSPLFAPSIGSWIASHHGWRVIFATLTGLAVIDLLLVAGLPKAYEPDKNIILKAKPIFKNFVEIFRIGPFRTYTIAGALSFAGLFVYLTGSPSIFIDGFGVSKEMFGVLFGLLAVAMIGGGQVNNLLLKRFESEIIFKRALMCQIVFSIAFLIATVSMKLGLVATTTCFFILLSAVGVAFPNAAALALKPITKNVGSASSLMGFLQMGLGAALSSLVGLIEVKGTLPTVLVISLSSVLAGYVLKVGSKG